MKVLIVGGLARSLINFRGTLISTLVDRGCDVVTAAPDATPGQVRQLEAVGARYRHVTGYRAGLNPGRDMGTVRELRALMADEMPDVLIAYTIKPIIYSGFAGKMRHAPEMFALVTGLGYSFGNTEGLKQRLVGAITRRMYRSALKRYEGVLFQNPDDQADFGAAGLLGGHLRQRRVNGSGVDLRHFAREELPENPSFLMIARLLREKGVYEYINAVSERKVSSCWRNRPQPEQLVERAIGRGIRRGRGRVFGSAGGRQAIASRVQRVRSSFISGGDAEDSP